MAPRSRDPDQPGISEAVRAKRLKMQEIGRQMEAAPPRSVVRKPRADDRDAEDREREENLQMAVDPRTGKLPMAIIENDEADPYHPRYRGTQTEEGMKWTGAIPEEERAYMHLGPPGTRPSGIPLPPRQPAPPLNKPPIAPPSVPAAQLPPRTTPATPQTLPRGGIRGGGGTPPQRGGTRPDAAMPPPRQINPLGLSPMSPFKYEQGGKVIKHGSSTSIACNNKHR